jgi:type VI secretion system protein ImpH
MTAQPAHPLLADTDERQRLLGALVRDPQGFDLPTAVRVADASGNRVEIVSDASTRLAAGAVTEVERRGGTVRIRATVAGLVGAFGALPPAYSETVLAQEKRRSPALRAFLDVFAEPLLRLMVDAEEKYRLPRLLRWQGTARRNRIVGAVLALAGLRSEASRRRNPVGDAPVLRYAGFFGARTRNASSLRAMLASHTNLPVEIEQFVGRWVEVPASERSAIGAPAGSRLGVDAMAGAAVRDHAGSFRVVLGPVRYADYLSLEPGSPRLAEIMALTRLFVGPALRFDVQVVLAREDVPFTRLGDAASPPKLGWNAWARSAPAGADSRDAIVPAPR